MRVLYFTSIFLCIFACKSIENLPALAENTSNLEEELQYIYKSDQQDRRKVLFKVLFQAEDKYLKDPKIITVSNRDSLRLSRVIELDNATLIHSDLDKYHAAFIYLHGGGIKMQDDISYLERSTELFKELMLNSSIKKLKRRGKVYYKESLRQLEWIKK